MLCVYLALAVAAMANASVPPSPPSNVAVDEKGREVEAMKAFQVAESLQAEGNIQEALSAYEEVLKKHPDTTLKKDILIKIARCHSRLGDDDSAIGTYLRLISDSPDSIEASQAVSLMMSLYTQRYRFDEVIAMSGYLVQQFPGTEAAAMALYRAAGYLYSQGEVREAIGEYESFINQFPKSIMRATAFNRLISLYIKESMFEEAEARLMDKLAKSEEQEEGKSPKLHVLSSVPKDTYTLRQLALVYQKQGKYDRALDLYQQILSAAPNDVDIYEQLGELYAEKGDNERAIAEWSRITESAPGQYSRHQTLAYILKSHGFHDEAAVEYRKAIELQPQLPYLYTQLADVYVVKKQFDSAIDVYLDALAKFPVNFPRRPEVTTTMLELCDLEGLYGKVISSLRTRLIQSPESIPTLLTLADVYFHRGDFDDSLQQFRTIASLYPDKGGILFDHAQTLERERQFDHAIKFYQTVVDLFPGGDISSHALMHIGQLKYRLHQPQAAIASLRILIPQISSSEGRGANSLWLPAYILIGDIHLQQMHDVQTALSTYTEARSVLEAQSLTLDNPAHSMADLDLRIAECYRLMGRYDMAESVLDSMQTRYRSKSTVAQIAKSRGDCYFSRGAFDSALTQYQEAIRWLMNEDWVNDCLDRMALIKEYSDQGSQAPLEVHARVERLRKLGQYSEALALCVSATPTDRIQLAIGDLLALQLKAMEAVWAYEELVQSHSPLASEAQFRIAQLYWQQLNDAERAIEEYSALIENYPDSVMVADARRQIRRLAFERAPGSNLP